MIGTDLATGDFVKQLLMCSSHDYLLMFTDRGRVFWLKTYQIPEAARYSKGKALVNILDLKEEKVNAIVPVSKFENALFIS